MERVQLRGTLRQLRLIDFDKNDPTNIAMAPQEMLDFLALLDGLKPVYLSGRGFDDATWVAAVQALARRKGLHVIQGIFWNAMPRAPHGLPTSVAALLAPIKSPTQTATYICKAPAIARELKDINASGHITIEDEARLLGYPVCCVRDYYFRREAMDKVFSLMLQRVSGGDEEEMKRLIREDVGMAPETEEEQALAALGSSVGTLTPFTSVHMCEACASAENSPAQVMAKRYAALAGAIDPGLYQEIETYARL